MATRAFAVGASCPFVGASVGAVYDQSLPWAGRPGRHGSRGLRQVHAVDRMGRTAAWTGGNCVEWCGSASADPVSVAGNMLAGSAVVEDTLASFATSAAALPDRLMAALGAVDGEPVRTDGYGRDRGRVARTGHGFALPAIGKTDRAVSDPGFQIASRPPHCDKLSRAKRRRRARTSAMADRLEPTGFWSYSTTDDRSSGGRLSQLRVRLANELQLYIGRQRVQIFQDVNAIPHGTEWEQEIHRALAQSSFMIPIVTPGFLQSEWCCKEILRFRDREIALKRADLIFPFLYISIEHVDPERPDECFSKEVYQLLKARQHFDFRDLRFHDPAHMDVARRLDTLASSISAALRRGVPTATPTPLPPVKTPELPKPAVVAAAGPEEPDFPDGPEMLLIPKGSFIMGVPAGEEDREGVPKDFRGWSVPRKRITFDQPFWLGKYPVTRFQFATFVAETGHKTPNQAWTFEPDDKGEWKYELSKNRDWRNPGFQQTDGDPVVCVSHDDALAYVAWLEQVTGNHYRLPSEAEWEYAARAGTTTARFWGDGRAEATRYAKVADRTLMTRVKRDFDPEQFFDGESPYPFTAPVGSFLPNQFGLYDMLGNVWEWMADYWVENLKQTPMDGTPNTTGDSSRRVLRGGSWVNSPRVVRAGYRYWNDTGNRNNLTGFRVARTSF